MATKKNGPETGSGKQASDKTAAAVKKDSSKNAVPPGKAAVKDLEAKDSTKEKKKGEQSGLLAAFKEGRQFLKDVAIEFNKITWPQRQQVIQETISVLVLVTIITLMVLAFDWFLGNAIFGPLEHFARMNGGGIGRG